jgi:hypothetical protein
MDAYPLLKPKATGLSFLTRLLCPFKGAIVSITYWFVNASEK